MRIVGNVFTYFIKFISKKVWKYYVNLFNFAKTSLIICYDFYQRLLIHFYENHIY